MKTKTYKLFGFKIFETTICENEEEVEKQAILEEKPKEEGAVIDYTPDDEAYDLEKQRR